MERALFIYSSRPSPQFKKQHCKVASVLSKLLDVVLLSVGFGKVITPCFQKKAPN